MTRKDILKLREIVDEAMYETTGIRNTNKLADFGGRKVEVAIPRLH